ncbi:MAG: hypothetical protein ACK55Z_26335 [bacterium]|jgi:hypothetical protein
MSGPAFSLLICDVLQLNLVLNRLNQIARFVSNVLIKFIRMDIRP